MKYVNIKQIVGFILIVMMMFLNVLLILTCMDNNSCYMMDTYSWGFMNGFVIMIGLLMLGDKK